MQQILNYTTKVERFQHLYQEQGEINRYIQTEDFNKFSEELKDKVIQPENSSTDSKIKDKEESEQSDAHHHPRKKKKHEHKKEMIEITEDEASIDFKV